MTDYDYYNGCPDHAYGCPNGIQCTYEEEVSDE